MSSAETSIRSTKRACSECGTFINGRIDKKFCSDYCRASFHNKKKGEESPVLREILMILRKNRSILQDLIECGNRTISKARLILKGFAFDFNTHQIVQGNRNPLYFCFEYGYQNVSDEVVLLLDNEFSLQEMQSQVS